MAYSMVFESGLTNDLADYCDIGDFELMKLPLAFFCSCAIVSFLLGYPSTSSCLPFHPKKYFATRVIHGFRRKSPVFAIVKFYGYHALRHIVDGIRRCLPLHITSSIIPHFTPEVS